MQKRPGVLKLLFCKSDLFEWTPDKFVKALQIDWLRPGSNEQKVDLECYKTFKEMLDIAFHDGKMKEVFLKQAFTISRQVLYDVRYTSKVFVLLWTKISKVTRERYNSYLCYCYNSLISVTSYGNVGATCRNLPGRQNKCNKNRI